MKVAIDIGSSVSPLVNETFGITSLQLNNKLVDLLKIELDTCEVVVLSPSSPQHLAELIAAVKPSKCISISYATYNGCMGGTETVVTAGGSNLGKELHKAVVDVLDLRDRGTSKEENQYKIPYARMVLGYLDNDVDTLVIESNLGNLARAIGQVLL